MRDFKWYRRLTRGTWYYLRPANPEFSYMRYWSRRKPLANEVLIKEGFTDSMVESLLM